jgi:hypothetical protein
MGARDSASGHNTCCVISAKRVSESYDEHTTHRTLSCTRLPEASSTRTFNAILPAACVEQLKHGSNILIPASIRFKIPSVMFPPSM